MNSILRIAEEAVTQRDWDWIIANIRPGLTYLSIMISKIQLSDNEFDKLVDWIIWAPAIKSQVLSAYTLDRYKELIEQRHKWIDISLYQSLSISMLDRFSDYIRRGDIIYNDTLTDLHIEIFADRINWEDLALDRHLSRTMILRHMDFLDPRNMWSGVNHYTWSELNDEGLLNNKKNLHRTENE